MTELDAKINEYFPGVVVRKDLVKEVKGNAIVPTYVLEYLLGQYCATNDEPSIQSGIETVKNILQQHYVHRNEAGLTKSIIREKGCHKIIDKISIELNDKDDVYEAKFSNLGIGKVLVTPDTIKKHPKLLVSGVWCIASVEYTPSEDAKQCPWILESLKPIQLSHFDRAAYLEARKKFSTNEWIDLLLQSMGFNPELFGRRNKMFQLMRLIPYCERNYNLIELGPKGTGKSHIYSEFSPHGILLSGGEVSVPKLFVNNSSGKLGLVGYWNAIAFDEFAGKQKKPDKKLADIMKNYMANKSFSRGVETLGAEASLVFVGNTQHSVPYMLKHSDLFDELPECYHDSAFLDRIHFYIPGWEIDIIRGEMFSNGYGFVVDYLAEILRAFRDYDFSQNYKKFFSLDSSISTRDRDAIQKTVSGLLKIIFPHGEVSEEDMQFILHFAIEGRKRVKDQIMRFDFTYSKPKFSYTVATGEAVTVKTLEEEEYPQYYFMREMKGEDSGEGAIDAAPEVCSAAVQDKTPALKAGHITFHENQKGVSYDKLLIPYLKDTKKILITDAYLRLYYQIRNLMELIEALIKNKSDEEIEVEVITAAEALKPEQQIEFFSKIEAACISAGVKFTWRFDDTGTLHARHIVTDTGWKILLDRGLDIFQHYEMNDTFSLQNRLQEYRQCKAFEITYMKLEE